LSWLAKGRWRSLAFIIKRQDVVEARIAPAIISDCFDKLFLATKTIKNRMTRKRFIRLGFAPDFAVQRKSLEFSGSGDIFLYEHFLIQSGRELVWCKTSFF
jgi:hypothetical protein